MNQNTEEFDVIVAGAGPVGLCLAIDLGRRGIRCLLLERNPSTAPWPKMDRCNPRTMEIFRRLGIAGQIRALGYPAENPMDVFLVSNLSEPALVTLPFDSVAQCRETIANTTDASQPLEPYQLVSQNAVEPFLKELAENTENVEVRYGCGVNDFVQDNDGVTVTGEALDGGGVLFRGKYLVGCDGGRSTIRKKLGIELKGQGGMRELCQTIFWSEQLYEKIAAGKGRHYCFADGGSITAQGNRKEFTFHSALPVDTDFAPVLRRVIGFDCDVEIRHTVGWRHNLLLADRYRDGRVLMAGDAVHLVIPTGGLGMNTGVGDAFDLSWKLAATLQGWGGPALLNAYEFERRYVAQRNIEASGWAAGSVIKWISQYTPKIYDGTPEGEIAKRKLCEAFAMYHSRMYSMIGVELGYSYAWSPIVADEPDNVPEWDIVSYKPHAKAGCRIPHIWLKDGRAIQDLLGQNYTLVDLQGRADSAALEAAFKTLKAPLEVLRLDEPHVREVYGCSLLLLRPDLHIAWRGDALPAEVATLAGRVTGH